MELIKYPSIEQFRHTVYNVNHSYNYIGMDENNEPIYDVTKEKPTLTFKGSVKLHGSNASVCYNDKELWCQSHKRIITSLKDNAGFAFFVETKKDVFIKIFKEIKDKHDIDTSKNTIVLYGEWAGIGIQSKVAISNIPKTFFIIGIKLANPDPEISNKWIDCTGYKDNENHIYNIHDFKTYTIDIDFNHPELSQNKIIEQTLEVENECPVSKEFGFEGIGEGIVYTYVDENNIYTFKSKGVKHQNSKVKTLKHVDDKKIKMLIEIAEQVTPEWRLEQFLTEICDLNNGGEIHRSKIADFIRAVIADIIKEDLDILSKVGIELKEIGKYISTICRDYFFKQEKL